MCQPTDLLSAAPALAADLEALSAALLLAAKNLGCGASGACLTGARREGGGAGRGKGAGPGEGEGGGGGLQIPAQTIPQPMQ